MQLREKKVNKKEAILALLDYLSSEIYFDENKMNPFMYRLSHNGKEEELQREWSNIAEYKIKVEWHENIPKGGVLCWIWDFKEKNKFIGIISEYNKENPFSFIGSNCNWKNAIPLTEEEALEVVYKWQNMFITIL